MPRKRWKYRLSVSDVSTVDPNDRHAVDDKHIVRHALVDLEELAVLSVEQGDRLVTDLVRALGFHKAGIKAGRRGVSDCALANEVLLADIARALRVAGLKPTRWRKRYDNGAGESLYFELAHALAEAAGFRLPVDLKVLGRQAARVCYEPVAGAPPPQITLK